MDYTNRARAVTLMRLILPVDEVIKACDRGIGTPVGIYSSVLGTVTAEELPIVTAYLEDLVAEGVLCRRGLNEYGRTWRPR